MGDGALLLAFAGWFLLGVWWRDALSMPAKPKRDVGLELLARMAGRILDKRKLVGSEMHITASEKFSTEGEDWTISLTASSHPQTIESKRHGQRT